MGIWVFYLLAMVPLLIGGVLWLRDPKIVWQEWILGSALAFLLALIFQFVSIWGMTSDIETWSGQIDHATFYPEWVEEYLESHTASCGKNCTYTYYTVEHRTHYEYWECYTTIPDDHLIDINFFKDITKNFGGNIRTEKPWKSGLCSGDPNVYSIYNMTGFIYPVTALKSWSNRIKAAPTLFSFTKLPDTVKVYDWPANPNWLVSERLLGTAFKDINKLEFDRMNARLALSKKKVNVIMVGFGDLDDSYAEWQKAKYVGGKKNDLVLCYGNGWSKVFGWSESEICKRNLETIILKNKIDNNILPLIEQEIKANYQIKDWTKFDYIRVEPPTWSYWVFACTLAVFEVAFYFWANQNEFEKEEIYQPKTRRRRR